LLKLRKGKEGEVFLSPKKRSGKNRKRLSIGIPVLGDVKVVVVHNEKQMSKAF